MEQQIDYAVKELSFHVESLEQKNPFGIFGKVLINFYAVIALFTILFGAFLLYLTVNVLYQLWSVLPFLITGVLLTLVVFGTFRIDIGTIFSCIQ